MTEKVVVRIPPSPTGYFHIGRARTALFNYLFAKKNGGEIVFRIEDTDKERSKREYEEDIIESLTWLGITWDSGPFRQSERNDVYKKYIQKMLDEGTAYVSHEPEGENKEVIRFKNPSKTITFEDEVRGEISFETEELKDFVIARNIDDPLYHLTVVVDDHEMGVTHVIRGDDGISNTPRQILLQEAIGAKRPVYAHVPLILGADRSKMSARHGATSLRDFRAKGYLPEAMVNYLALLGWNPGTDQEIFTMEELISAFDLAKIQKGGAIFDEKKLDWVNKEHIKRLPPKVQEEMKLKEVGELPYIQARPEIDIAKLSWKQDAKEDTRKHLEKVKTLVGDDDAIMAYAQEVGKGSVLWPLRYALSGEEKSPDPFTLMQALGKEESIERIEKALELIK
jgi:nondiscriminating glutamyl-tRNA synthetase